MSTTTSPSCCDKCNLTFSEKKALRKHKREVHPPSLRCTKCNLAFSKKKVLRKHKREVHPPSFRCTECNLAFSKKKARFEHIREVHPKCKHCKKRLLGLEELRIHQQETGHFYCLECDIYFLGNDEHIAHVRNIQHTTQYHCCDCDREYTGQESLNHHCCDCDKVFISRRCLTKHFTKRTHIRNTTILEPQLDSNLSQKCEVCNEEFPSKKTLRKHLPSKHKAPRHIPCPVSGKCSKKFATPSALLNHLESGCCRSGMTRAKMAELVFAHDLNHYITSIDAACTPVQESARSQIPNPATPIAVSPHNFLAGEFTPFPLNTNDEDTTSEWSIINGVPLSPTTSEGASDWPLIHGVPLTPGISDDTSEWSFLSGNLITTPSNISASDINRATSISEVASPGDLRCHLCPPNRKPFGSARALQAHTASAAHAPKIYHCPLSFMPDVKLEDLLKRRSFSTLGGLTQHLESGRCSGGVEIYMKAITFVEEQLDLLGFSGIRLLSF
ncbi:hypothetical protein B0J14DRAFT_579637 [Halenospora varia]|nr:hypothetical protein B0J14DRAFT_579637 [Halenospora varia]